MHRQDCRAKPDKLFLDSACQGCLANKLFLDSADHVEMTFKLCHFNIFLEVYSREFQESLF